MRFSLATVAAIILSVQAGFAAAQPTAVREAIRVEIEQLRDTGILSIGGVDIAAGDVLAEVYEERNYAPNWTTQEEIAELLALIKASYLDGLDPVDYHLEEVEYVYRELEAGRLQRPREQAALDVMLTDSLFRLGYHRHFGKVNPDTLDPNWNFRRELLDEAPAETMQRAMDAESLAAFLDEVFPRHPLFIGLREALAEYRRIAEAGGWPQVPEGALLKPGDPDPRMAQLAQRLAATGDIAAGYEAGDVYDEVLVAGVEAFQARHRIDVDGVIGQDTLRALNLTVEARIDQLRVNLERARWVFDEIEDYFIVVNIAGFRAYVMRGGEPVWETPVQVGKTYHQTPVFRDEMKYVVINPTWTVPYSIATKEMLPRIKRDPDYFDSRDFDIKDRSGALVDPKTVDWSQLSRGNFPYTFVQRPGPGNALGRVKFIFPNAHAVYLHDTPSKALFGRAARAFSHGCVRVKDPFDFAEVLLKEADWDREKIDSAVDSLETTTVYLPRPVPVMLLYWTAETTADGAVAFYTDVYDRDQRVLDALAEPFQLELPDRS